MIHISLTYAAILAVIYVGLSIRVIKNRFSTKVLIGDGGNQKLGIAVRTHANFGEYIPLALMLIMGVELLQYPSAIVHGLGVVLVLGRLGHMHGLATNGSAGLGRPVGVVATLLLMLSSAVMILMKTL